MPKPPPIPDYMKRVPGRKAPYEIALEKEQEAARRALANPVIRDGGTFFGLFPFIPSPTDHNLKQISSTAHPAHINQVCQSLRSSSLHSNLFFSIIASIFLSSWSLVCFCCCSFGGIL